MKCLNHTEHNPHEEADCKIGRRWYCSECASDMAEFAEMNPRDTTQEDQRAAFNDRLDMYRNEF